MDHTREKGAGEVAWVIRRSVQVVVRSARGRPLFVDRRRRQYQYREVQRPIGQVYAPTASVALARARSLFPDDPTVSVQSALSARLSALDHEVVHHDRRPPKLGPQYPHGKRKKRAINGTSEAA